VTEKPERTSEWLEASKSVFRGENVIIAGKAGTGKSLWIREIDELLTNNGIVVQVVSPSATAAENVGGRTIHSVFNFQTKVDMLDSPASVHSKAREIIKGITTLIIDEYSMLSSRVLDAISLRCRQFPASVPWSTDSVSGHFGGRQVILVGDPLQLEPVITPEDRIIYGEEGYPSHFWFDAKDYDPLRFQHFCFTKPFRQADDLDFVALLDDLRHVTNFDSHHPTLHARREEMLDSGVDSSAVNLCHHNDLRLRMNKEELNRIDGPLRESRIRWIVGEKTDRAVPNKFEEVLQLKIGARVMFTKNKYNENKKLLWTNGSTGLVTGFTPESGDSITEVEVKLDNGRVVQVEREVHEEVQSIRHSDPGKKPWIEKKVIFSAVQFPLTLGWALTIHKSQGKTIGKIRIHLSDNFSPGMAYTALSRVRRLDDLTISGTVGPHHFPPPNERLKDYLINNFSCFGILKPELISPIEFA
jgi:ATP-dependent DNA helicase PIF1